MDTLCCDVIAVVYPKCENIAVENMLCRSLEQHHENIDMKWRGGLAGSWRWYRDNIFLLNEKQICGSFPVLRLIACHTNKQKHLVSLLC